MWGSSAQHTLRSHRKYHLPGRGEGGQSCQTDTGDWKDRARSEAGGHVSRLFVLERETGGPKESRPLPAQCGNDPLYSLAMPPQEPRYQTPRQLSGNYNQAQCPTFFTGFTLCRQQGLECILEKGQLHGCGPIIIP